MTISVDSMFRRLRVGQKKIMTKNFFGLVTHTSHVSKNKWLQYTVLGTTLTLLIVCFHLVHYVRTYTTTNTMMSSNR